MERKSEKSINANDKIDVKEIDRGILSLKKLTKSPEKGVSPLYSDKSSTIYLQCTPKKMVKFGFGGKDVTLPHSLSYNRNVCLLLNNMQDPAEAEAYADKMASLLKEIGVEGKIKVMPVTELQVIVRNNDLASLNEFAQTYDSYFGDKKAVEKVHKAQRFAPNSIFDKAMASYDKRFDRVDLRQDQKKRMEAQLASSALWLNSSQDAYVWKVGHTGHTASQLRENIEEALRTLDRLDMCFPGGIKFFKSLHLKTGYSDEVPLYVDVDPEPAEAANGSLVTEKAACNATGAVTLKSNKKKRKREAANEEPLQDASKQEIGFSIRNDTDAVTLGKKKKMNMKNKKNGVSLNAVGGGETVPKVAKLALLGSAKKLKNKKNGVSLNADGSEGTLAKVAKLASPGSAKKLKNKKNGVSLNADSSEGTLPKVAKLASPGSAKKLKNKKNGVSLNADSSEGTLPKVTKLASPGSAKKLKTVR